MRIAVVSDIHGNLPALEAIVEDIERRGVDAVVNLGDSVSGPLLPLETARFLMARDWIHLAGNHERLLLAEGPRGVSDEFARSQLTSAELEWLASLRPRLRIQPALLLCHGTPSSDSEYLLETVEPGRVRAATPGEIGERLGEVEEDVVLCGHSHVPGARRAPSGTLIVNPGSVGLQAFEDTHPHPHVIETGSPDARYAIMTWADGEWEPAHVSVPYAWGRMAELARSRQRADWEVALRTGRME
jgi:predicted phosphodiesterase